VKKKKRIQNTFIQSFNQEKKGRQAKEKTLKVNMKRENIHLLNENFV